MGSGAKTDSRYHGYLNIYKEPGYTSFDVVARLRGILHTRKIGHMGTLDPDAEGVLPVAVGKGTKAISLIEDTDKVYEAVAFLGRVTDTQDAGGRTLREAAVSCTREELLAAAAAFEGGYDQVPPMYSAKKIGGRRLYELAREGKEIQRKSVSVSIPEIMIKEIRLPRFTMSVTCGKGTYIRTLIHDIGNRLGCGGCMEHLTRTRVGTFDLADAITLDELETRVQSEQIMETILPLDYVFENLPMAVCRMESQKKALNGAPLGREDLLTEVDLSSDHNDYRVYMDKQFLGVYTVRNHCLKVKKLLL